MDYSLTRTCCLPLALLAGFGLSVRARAQGVDIHSAGLCESGAAPIGGPMMARCSEGKGAGLFPVALGPNPFAALGVAGGQDGAPPSNATPPPSPDPDPGSAPADPAIQTPEGGTRQVSWKKIVPNFFSDQARIWTFPIRLGKGRGWKPTLFIVGVTGGLLAVDPHAAGYFRTHDEFNTFNSVFSVTTTERVFLGLPVVYYLGALALHDNYAEQTAFFAAESLVDVDFLAGVMRSVDGRLHPRDIPPPPKGDYVHTWLKAKGPYLNRGSFPSGHTAGAFAVASIFALRYGRRHRWVPWVAYSLASLTALSRVAESAHFPSDAFMGGALAYTISRYAVLRLP